MQHRGPRNKHVMGNFTIGMELYGMFLVKNWASVVGTVLNAWIHASGRDGVSLNPHRVAQRCKRWAGGSVWLFSLIMVLAVIAAERHAQKGRRAFLCFWGIPTIKPKT